MGESHVTVNIHSGAIVKSLLVLLFVWVLYLLRDLVLVILTAIVLASAVEPMTLWFEKFKVPRIIAVIIIYFGTVLMLGGILYTFAPPLLSELSELGKNLPEYSEAIGIQDGGERAAGIFNSLESQFSMTELISRLSGYVSQVSTDALGLIATIFGGLLSFILIIVISFYLAVQKGGIREFLSLVTPIKHESYVLDLWKRAQKKIALWFQGQLLLALIIGVLVYLGLTIVGVKSALLLALIAALFEIIPIFGPILASVPALFIGYATGGISLFLIIGAIYVVIQQFENQLIYPLVVKKVVGVPPIISIVALIAGAQLAGFWGVILSIPLAAIFMEVLKDLDKEKSSVRAKADVDAT